MVMFMMAMKMILMLQRIQTSHWNHAPSLRRDLWKRYIFYTLTFRLEFYFNRSVVKGEPCCCFTKSGINYRANWRYFVAYCTWLKFEFVNFLTLLYLWFQTAKPGHESVAVNGQGSTGNVKASLPSKGENKSLPLITAKQYARREAHLSSLIVAWSPLVSSSDRASCLSRHWCILAVGSKSGNVSFWKLYKPEYYTIDAGMVTNHPILIGVLQAHKSWVSAITWEVSSAGSSKSSLLLATGCSDGRSVWLMCIICKLLCAFGFIMYWLFTWLFVSSLDSWHDKRDICDDHTHTHNTLLWAVMCFGAR